MLISGPGKPPVDAALAGAWPGFRGPNRDNIAPAGSAGPGGQLARSWPAAGPKALWSIPLGEGYAGAAVQDGWVYLLDYDAKASCDALRCLSLETGEEILASTPTRSE